MVQHPGSSCLVRLARPALPILGCELHCGTASAAKKKNASRRIDDLQNVQQGHVEIEWILDFFPATFPVLSLICPRLVKHKENDMSTKKVSGFISGILGQRYCLLTATDIRKVQPLPSAPRYRSVVNATNMGVPKRTSHRARCPSRCSRGQRSRDPAMATGLNVLCDQSRRMIA